MTNSQFAKNIAVNWNSKKKKKKKNDDNDSENLRNDYMNDIGKCIFGVVQEKFSLVIHNKLSIYA